MAACLGKQKFKSVTGKNLNEAKNRATAEALRHLKKMGKYELKSSQVIVFCKHFLGEYRFKNMFKKVS